MESLGSLTVLVLGVTLALGNVASIAAAVWLLVAYQKSLSFAAELIARMTEDSISYQRKADADAWASGRAVPQPSVPTPGSQSQGAQTLERVAAGLAEDAGMME